MSELADQQMLTALRKENAKLREKLAWIERQLRPPNVFSGAPLYLTRHQGWMLELMRRRDLVTREMMIATLWHDAPDSRSPKSLDVQICHLRHKIRGFGIDFDTVYNVGWRLSFLMKDRLKRMIGEIGAAA